MSSVKRKPVAPIDDNVKIPASVSAAAAMSDQAHAAVYGAPSEPAEPTPTEPITVEPVVESVAPAPAEPTTAPGTPEVIATPPAAPPVSEQSWEHRYNSMKGRFDRSEAANRTLTERVTSLEQVIATMSVTAPQPAPAPAPVVVEEITAAEREAYGEDFLNIVKKQAGAQVTPQVAQLQEEINNLRSRLDNVGEFVGETTRERTHAYLNQHTPNWLELNNDPRFIEWLSLPDPYTGAIRHELLKAAYAKFDAPRVNAFFQGFLAQEAAPAPQPEPSPTPAPVAAPKVPLETLAAPGRAKTAATNPVPAEKPIFTRAEITQFYVDVANGKYVGRETEKDRIEKQISDAAKDMRVR